MKAMSAISATAAAICSQRSAGQASMSANASAIASRAVHTAPKRVPVSTCHSPPCRQTAITGAP